jgi:hypothetical protein
VKVAMRITVTFTTNIDTEKAIDFFGTHGMTGTDARNLMRDRLHDIAVDEVEGYLEDNGLLKDN